MKKNAAIYAEGICGRVGGHEVFLGVLPARLLYKVSFADILDEDTGQGYQRPYNRAHSLDFKCYILRENSTTPPLTFNLRPDCTDHWRVERLSGNFARLSIDPATKCLAQVDCQHRLGELADCDVPLAFMTYIGLDLRQEMAIFNVINSKAKGLSSSLTDYHESKLLDNLAEEAPHLYIARRLNEDPVSPWYRLIRYGGETTSGLKRRTSFRMMQRAVRGFLSQTRTYSVTTLDDKYQCVLAYWLAVRETFPAEWDSHRHHLITKGVGLYSLMKLLADIVKAQRQPMLTQDELATFLSPLCGKFDWSSTGRFAYVGGQKGVNDVYVALKEGVGL